MEKPKKADRLADKSRKHDELISFRQVQSKLAILRDRDQCAFCWFLLGVEERREEIHHVYGRGKKAGDWREHYTSLVCTCRRHHPLPIQTPGGNPNLDWVEAVLKMANEMPINANFKGDNETNR